MAAEQARFTCIQHRAIIDTLTEFSDECDTLPARQATSTCKCVSGWPLTVGECTRKRHRKRRLEEVVPSGGRRCTVEDTWRICIEPNTYRYVCNNGQYRYQKLVGSPTMGLERIMQPQAKWLTISLQSTLAETAYRSGSYIDESWAGLLQDRSPNVNIRPAALPSMSGGEVTSDARLRPHHTDVSRQCSVRLPTIDVPLIKAASQAINAINRTLDLTKACRTDTCQSAIIGNRSDECRPKPFLPRLYDKQMLYRGNLPADETFPNVVVDASTLNISGSSAHINGVSLCAHSLGGAVHQTRESIEQPLSTASIVAPTDQHVTSEEIYVHAALTYTHTSLYAAARGLLAGDVIMLADSTKLPMPTTQCLRARRRSLARLANSVIQRAHGNRTVAKAAVGRAGRAAEFGTPREARPSGGFHGAAVGGTRRRAKRGLSTVTRLPEVTGKRVTVDRQTADGWLSTLTRLPE